MSKKTQEDNVTNTTISFFFDYKPFKKNTLNLQKDLFYPINYKGPEKTEKKVLDKIISFDLLLDDIFYDEEFGEIATFISRDKTEQVTYVICRKPYNIDKNNILSLSKQSFFKTVFNKDCSSNCIKSFFDMDLFPEEEPFQLLYKVLNNNTPLDTTVPNYQLRAKKNICHRLIAFYENDKESKNTLENILQDNDFLIL